MVHIHVAYRFPLQHPPPPPPPPPPNPHVPSLLINNGNSESKTFVIVATALFAEMKYVLTTCDCGCFQEQNIIWQYGK